MFCLPCRKIQLQGVFLVCSTVLCVRGWLAKELKNLHIDDQMELCLISDLYNWISLHIGSRIENIVTFPSFRQREHASYIIKFCCLCLGHVVPKLLSVTLGSLDKSIAELNLSKFKGIVHSYLLSSSAEQNIFTSAQ